MGDRRDVRGGSIRRCIEPLQSYTQHLGDLASGLGAQGYVSTDGVQYGAISTFGTTAVAIIDELIDPGFDMQLTEIEVELTQKFNNVKDAVGSLTYYWLYRQENIATTSSWIAMTGTYTKGIGSLSNSEDTFSGYLSKAVVHQAPIRVKLEAFGLVASSMTGKLRRDSYVYLAGTVIPGT